MRHQRRGSRSRCRSPKQKRQPGRAIKASANQAEDLATEAEDRFRGVFSEATVDRLRAQTGYNPRQRKARAIRLLLVVVEAFLFGQSLGFNVIRAFFVRRYGSIRARAFQLRFKSAEAVSFFKAALDHLVAETCAEVGVSLDGALAPFEDVHVFDGTGQRVPPRGAKNPALKGCTKGKAGSKWVVGYSLRTGVAFGAQSAAETASEIKLWRQLVGTMQRGVLYLLDLGFYSKDLFREAQREGAHVLMRLKSRACIRVLGNLYADRMVYFPEIALSTYLSSHSHRKGTMVDLDVRWGKAASGVPLRLVGFSLGGKKGWRFYLTTVPRSMLSAEQIIEAYRLRWLVEFLFREWKQQADLGRSFTADRNALDALTYGAMLAHALVRSLRVTTALRNGVPLEQLRPLACLHAIRPFAAEIIDALASRDRRKWQHLLDKISVCMMEIAHEAKPSRSRPRVARTLGAGGG